MRRFAGFVAALGLVAGSASAAAPSSGLQGTVIQLGGACADGTNCEVPVPGITLAFSRSGQSQVRMRTRDDGSYRVRLVPGAYTVRVVGEGRTARVRPSTAYVRRARFARVQFVLWGIPPP